MVADCVIFSLREGGPTAERNQANARLIAAAPDLLAAAAAAGAALLAFARDSTAYEQGLIVAALKNAEGRS